jgi:Fic family protein
LRDKPNALGLLDDLFVNPYMSISRASKLLSKTHPTAKAAITVLEENGILKEISGRQWGRFYVCSPVLNALEKPIA